MGVVHAEKDEEIESQENKRSSVVAHKDNISILVPSSNDLVPMYHRTSALDHYRRSTADTAYTTRGCSPEADN